MALTKELESELEAIRSLAEFDGGPIADTYDRLQGLPFLRAARPPISKLADETDRMGIALHQSLGLAQINLWYLLEHNLANARPDEASIIVCAENMLWVRSIAKLSYDLARSLSTLRGKIKTELLERGDNSHISHTLSLMEAFEDRYLKTELGRRLDTINRSIENEYSLDPDAIVIHELKTSQYLVGLAHAYAGPSLVDEYFQEEVLFNAVHSINTSRKTYLMQFRLLHQIPEILSAEIVDILEGVTKGLNDRSELNLRASLNLAIDAFTHIVSSLLPLTELMYPSEYHAIRRHLGKTSGSKSNAIATQMLKSTYLALAEAYLDRLKAPDAPNLDLELRQIHMQIVSWRDLHVILPRNVLGEQATSLIGSVNAPKSVEGFRMAFERQPVAVAIAERLGVASHLPRPQRDVPDSLMKRTGIVTRERFDDVEKRTGRYSPQPRERNN